MRCLPTLCSPPAGAGGWHGVRHLHLPLGQQTPLQGQGIRLHNVSRVGQSAPRAQPHHCASAGPRPPAPGSAAARPHRPRRQIPAAGRGAAPAECARPRPSGPAGVAGMAQQARCSRNPAGHLHMPGHGASRLANPCFVSTAGLCRAADATRTWPCLAQPATASFSCKPAQAPPPGQCCTFPACP